MHQSDPQTNTSESTAIISKTTGMSSSLLQNLLTITHRALPPAFHLSSLIRDIIQISWYTLSATSPLPEQKNSLQISTTYTENSESRLPKLKNVIKDQLIHAEPRHRTSVLVNKCLSKQHISGRQDLRRNYRKRTLDLSKLSLKLDQHPSPYDSPNI